MTKYLTEDQFNVIDVVSISTATTAWVTGDWITALAAFVTGLALSMWLKS